MNNLYFYKAVITLFFILVLASCQTKQSAERKEVTVEITEPTRYDQSKYVPFPEGYGYMVNLQELQKATDQGDTQKIRQHAWGLWAGIMQPVAELGWPVWYTWPNTKGAFVVSDKQLSHEKAKKSMLSKSKTGKSLRAINKINKQSAHAPSVDTPAPTYEVPQAVIEQFPDAICTTGSGSKTICDGQHFVNNGDIMIPTESLSQEAMHDIRKNKLYLKSTLDKAHTAGKSMIGMTDRFIVTKHMYWPVKAVGVTMIPVWKDNYPDSYTGYAGYEFWDTMVALEPNNPSSVGTRVEGAFLYQVLDHSGTQSLPTVHGDAIVFDINNFYHHQVTQADWDSFDVADKAIITAASYWANDKPFEVGDYLVSIAMHVNTKELESWTLQSVWWSDAPDEGIYAQNRPELSQAQGPWDHYLLTSAYAVPAINDRVEKAVNPYIEGVIHPIATNCRNCHVRAGWPQGKASYQNADCPDLLADLTPSSQCLQGITLSDYLWIIPDRAQ